MSVPAINIEDALLEKLRGRMVPHLKAAIVFELPEHAAHPDFEQVFERISERLTFVLSESVEDLDDLIT